MPRPLLAAMQREPGEAEHRLDDAEGRLDGLPAKLVGGTALFARELLRHRLQPIGLGLLCRRESLHRAEVVCPTTAFRRGRHQRLDAARLERRHLRAVGIAVVREHRLRPAQRRRDRLDVRHQVVAVAGALADPRAHDQLTAAGIHRRLRVVGLTILMVLALAHQPAVRVAQIALRVRSRRLGRRLRMLALGTTAALLPRRHFGLVGLALRCRPRLSLRLQTATGRIELVAQGLAAGNLLRQGLGIILASRVCRLRPAQKRRDLAFQLGDQRARTLVRHRAMLAGIGHRRFLFTDSFLLLWKWRVG